MARKELVGVWHKPQLYSMYLPAVSFPSFSPSSSAPVPCPRLLSQLIVDFLQDLDDCPSIEVAVIGEKKVIISHVMESVGKYSNSYQFQSFIKECMTKVWILQKQLEHKEISLHNVVGKHILQQP